MGPLNIMDMPAINQFKKTPNRETAKNLTEQVLNATERLDGQTGRSLLEAIRIVGTLNQYQVQRSRLIRAYKQHLHDDNAFGQRRAIVLMIENAERARLENDGLSFVQNLKMALSWALEGGWDRMAFWAGYRMAINGLSREMMASFERLAKRADELESQTQDDKTKKYYAKAKAEFLDLAEQLQYPWEKKKHEEKKMVNIIQPGIGRRYDNQLGWVQYKDD